MSADDTVRAYKDLARVERAFRSLKSIDLQIRPVHLWIEPRVRAHVFLCMLAYYIEWHLCEASAPILFQEHDRAAARRQHTSPVADTEVSKTTRRKHSRRRSDDGVPITSFSGLIDHLATLTLNVAVPPQAPNATMVLTATHPHGSNANDRYPACTQRPGQEV